MSKYKKGEQFSSIAELASWVAEGNSVYIWNKFMHFAWVRNFQFHYLVELVNSEAIKKAIEVEKMKIIIDEKYTVKNWKYLDHCATRDISSDTFEDLSKKGLILVKEEQKIIDKTLTYILLDNPKDYEILYKALVDLFDKVEIDEEGNISIICFQ